MSELADIFLALMQRVQELERRTAGSQWRGTVKEVDPKKGTARLVIGQDDDGQDVLSPPIPYAQTAGALKIHSPPSVGQQMEVYSQGGDIEQATLRPLHWSKDNVSPSDKGDEHVATLGQFKAEVRGGELVITVPKVRLVCGGSSFELTNAGLTLVASDVAVTGDTMKHNGKSIDANHIHGGVMPGGATTDVPAN